MKILVISRGESACNGGKGAPSFKAYMGCSAVKCQVQSGVLKLKSAPRSCSHGPFAEIKQGVSPTVEV
jgi:hypothetical protein